MKNIVACLIWLFSLTAYVYGQSLTKERTDSFPLEGSGTPSPLSHPPNTTTPPSLFFTKDESTVIEDLVTKIKPEHADTTGIHLGAVMYYGPDDWTTWIQGQKWTPDTVPTDIQIVSVTENEVHISWRRKPEATPQDIILHPYQTYDIGTGRIVEGMR